ncbi:DUF5668 domain-containing protein [Bacillus sp. MUM 13]|uniref:LiaI-LiaF-like domain-containing protein n=1 Tax=Bacillus sp. MUM 13 TaxID=1678001 RepID=UPI0008F55EEE|nr:DUF5668 domain-containing protein [Bacillus sp. MUM 13]OIK14367.1 hypothetical protein BIV59_03705 [Bacillus sp. MUM 13]
MKSQRIFPGLILIGFGLYFFLKQANIELFQGFFNWPTILCIVGIAFLIQAYSGKDNEAILPGVILFGFGLHFHVVHRLEIWPDNIGVFILIIALGFILRARASSTGLFHGVVLLVISLLSLFYDKITGMMGLIKIGTADPAKFWPFIVMLIGIILLVKKK